MGCQHPSQRAVPFSQHRAASYQPLTCRVQVKSIREYATRQLAALLTDSRLYSGGAVNGIGEVSLGWHLDSNPFAD